MTMKKDNKYLLVFTVLSFLFTFLFSACVDGLVFDNYQRALDPPERVSVSDITYNSALVSWSPVKRAKLYLVCFGFKEELSLRSFEVTDTSFLLEDLLFDENYIVEVYAFSQNQILKEFSGYASEVEFKTPLDPVPEGEYARPTNLNAVKNQNDSSITISWDSIDDASYYEIKFRFICDEQTIVINKIIAADQCEYTYTDSLPGDSIYINVAARNSNFSDTCRWSKTIRLKK